MEISNDWQSVTDSNALAGIRVRRATQSDLQNRNTPYPVISTSQDLTLKTRTFQDPTIWRLNREGLKANSAVAASFALWTLGYTEAGIKVYENTSKGFQPVAPEDRLQMLLERPNPNMDWGGMMELCMTYKLLEGNAYIVAARSSDGRVQELWPYHGGNISPVPSKTNWIDHYNYYNDGVLQKQIDPNDVIHLKWPFPDADFPWKAASPTLALAREIDSDVEATKMFGSFLMNDAMPRVQVKVSVPPGTQPNDSKFQQYKAAWQEKFGNTQRGNPIFTGLETIIQRLALDMKELDFATLRKTIEARICAVYMTPIELVGLTAGLENSTYSNKDSALQFWTQNKLVPMWRRDARAIGHFFQKEPEWQNVKIKIEYDTAGIVGLRDTNAKLEQSTVLLKNAGIITVNEAREVKGLAPVAGGDVLLSASALTTAITPVNGIIPTETEVQTPVKQEELELSDPDNATD